MENGVMGEKRRTGMGDTDEIDLGCSRKQKTRGSSSGEAKPKSCYLFSGRP